MNDRAPPQGTAPMDVVSDPNARSRMRRMRKHLLPLHSESMSPIDLPSVRTGLLTKLNALTVGLIALTALAISAYYFWQQWSNEGTDLRHRGRTIAAVFAEQAEFGVYTADRASLDPMLESLAGDRDLAYVIFLDRKLAPILERRFSRALGNQPIPALPPGTTLPQAGRMVELSR